MPDTKYTHTGYEHLYSQQEATDENKLHLAVEDFSDMYEQAFVHHIHKLYKEIQ